jgi:hypothetical protein
MATTDDPQLKAKKTNVGGESVEEHSLADRVKFEQHSTAQQAQTATPAVGKTGLPVFRTRMRHGRP